MFEVGDYVWSDCVRYYSSNRVMKVLGTSSREVYVRGAHIGSWLKKHTRKATEDEILASKYAEEYKSKYKAKNELQKEITTNGSAIRSEAIRSRRRAIKITSSGRLIGNSISIIQRKRKIGKFNVCQTPIFISRG